MVPSSLTPDQSVGLEYMFPDRKWLYSLAYRARHKRNFLSIGKKNSMEFEAHSRMSSEARAATCGAVCYSGFQDKGSISDDSAAALCRAALCKIVAA